MQAPIASGIPIGGSYSEETAQPAVETSMMKQGFALTTLLVPSS